MRSSSHEGETPINDNLPSPVIVSFFPPATPLAELFFDGRVLRKLRHLRRTARNPVRHLVRCGLPLAVKALDQLRRERTATREKYSLALLKNMASVVSMTHQRLEKITDCARAPRTCALDIFKNICSVQGLNRSDTETSPGGTAPTPMPATRMASICESESFLTVFLLTRTSMQVVF